MKKRALRIITNSSRFDPSSPIFDSLNILPLNKVYQYKIATMMFKFSKDLLPAILIQFYTSQIHDHWTRQELHVPNITKPSRQRTIAYQGPIIHLYFSRKINTNCKINTYKKTPTYTFKTKFTKRIKNNNTTWVVRHMHYTNVQYVTITRT